MNSCKIIFSLLILSFIAITAVQMIDGLDNKESKNLADDYYSSLIGVQNLAKQEQKLVAKLVGYKRKLTETLETIDYYLDDYSKDIHSVIKRHPQLRDKFCQRKYPILKNENDLKEISDEMTANPLMVFKLLRRIATELIDIQLDTDKIQDHLEFKDYINSFANSMKHPTVKDLLGAADGLLRLQETYQLPTTDMSSGLLIEKRTGCKLLASDMHFIGVQAVNQERFATGLEWLYDAYEKVLKGDDSLPMDVIKGKLLIARNLHNNELLKFKYAPSNLFSNLVNSTYTNIPELFIPPAIWEYPLALTTDTLFDLYNFNALCRGEQLLSAKISKSLRCWYSHENSPFNVISPLKIEMHHENPPVLQIYDLISDRIINHIKNKSLPYMKRSQVVGGIESDVRTSSVAWLNDRNTYDNLLNKIPKIVKRTTGLMCETTEAAEDLQVSCYGSVGGHYIPHFDALVDPNLKYNPEDEHDLEKGDRIATTMFYLSDVEVGGGTAFPRLGVAAKPIKWLINGSDYMSKSIPGSAQNINSNKMTPT